MLIEVATLANVAIIFPSSSLIEVITDLGVAESLPTKATSKLSISFLTAKEVGALLSVELAFIVLSKLVAEAKIFPSSSSTLEI